MVRKALTARPRMLFAWSRHCKESACRIPLVASAAMRCCDGAISMLARSAGAFAHKRLRAPYRARGAPGRAKDGTSALAAELPWSYKHVNNTFVVQKRLQIFVLTKDY